MVHAGGDLARQPAGKRWAHMPMHCDMWGNVLGLPFGVFLTPVRKTPKQPAEHALAPREMKLARIEGT